MNSKRMATYRFQTGLATTFSWMPCVITGVYWDLRGRIRSGIVADLLGLGVKNLVVDPELLNKCNRQTFVDTVRHIILELLILTFASSLVIL